MNCECLLALFWILIKPGSSANILGFFTSPSISHQVGFQAICKQLTLKGHNVTVVSPNILDDPTLKNLEEIDISQVYDSIRNINIAKFMKDAFHLRKLLEYFKVFRTTAIIALEDEKVQKLFKSHKKFDIVIVQAIHPVLFSVAAKFRVPVVGKLVTYATTTI